MIFRSWDDAVFAGCALVMVTGIALIGVMFWWPLLRYSIGYWVH